MESLDEFVGEMISACSELGGCWEDQIHAVWALGRVGPSARASVPSLIALLEHGTRGVREEALGLGASSSWKSSCRSMSKACEHLSV